MSHMAPNLGSVMDFVTVKDVDATRTIVACAIYLVQLITPAVLLVSTSKRSIFRAFWTPCSLLLFYQLFSMSREYTGSLVRFYQGTIPVLLTAIHAFNLMHLNPLDRAEIVSHTGISPESYISALCQSTRLLFGLRGFRTPWQVKGIPGHPPYVLKKGTTSIRSRYLIRQSFLLAWQYLALDTFSVWSARQAGANRPPSSAYLPLGVRVSMTLATWFGLARLIIDSFYRLGALIAVILGDAPYNWPPAMGSMWDAYTLRNFWRFWHQFMRWPLTSLSNFIARDVMKLPRPSILERYVNISLVFFCSGLIHIISDMIQGVSFEQSGSMTFFLGCALGIMIEDGVQHAFLALTGTDSRKSDSAPQLWKRIIGFSWVVAWLCLLSPSHLLPLTDLPKENRWFVPVSFVSYMGVETATKSLLAGAVVLVLHFEASL